MAKTQVLFGDRIGKEGLVRLGCSAVIYDYAHEKILLTQRTDNEQWCLPSGRHEAGESVAETCVREVFEETGARIKIIRITGVYSDPNKLVVYPDGNKVHIVALNFEAEIIDGEIGISDETLAWGFYSIEEARQLDMLAGHLERIEDTNNNKGTLIK